MAASRKSSVGGRNGHLSFPTVWLFTDERLGGASPEDALWRAAGKLPRGGGIVFRHYTLAPDARAALLQKLEMLARRRGLRIVASGLPGASGGVHRPRGASRRACENRRGLITASAHNAREMAEAFRRGAHLVFLSPVFPTRSHPGAPVLGAVRFGLIARRARGPVLALGGVGPRAMQRLGPLGAAGYGAIDAWCEGPQKPPGGVRA